MHAFSGCTGLTSIEIPNSVTSIGYAAFDYCSGLTSVTIGNSVTSIGQYAFRGCSGLTSITIPSSVTSIDEDAFLECTNITDVYCYPSAANLTWNEGWKDDFKADGSTRCHVDPDQLSAYQEKFTEEVNVTFVGGFDPPAYTVTLKEGTVDASNWQGKAGEGEYQALPLEGVAAGTAVTVKYNGTKKVKSVTEVTGAWAEELTVHDGTTTNQFVPIYGKYADAYNKCEMVMPASELSAMNGSEISAMTFYASQTNVSWGDTSFKVFLKEVSSTTIGGFSGPGTVVYEGTLSIVDGKMTVTFTTPYTYNGGNLLIGVYITVLANKYSNSNWYGETVSGASVQGYNKNGLAAVTATQRNFLPKTTFTYYSSAVPWNATTKQTTFTMPDTDVELEIEYYDEVTLTDGSAITALNDYTEQEIWVNYTRSFTEGKTSTVCLPFAYTKKAGDGSFYAFTNIEKVGSEYVATMTEPGTTTLEANTPYLYMPNATGDVDFSGLYTIPATLTAGSTTSNGWTFKGTFTTIEWTTAPTGTYGFSAQTQDGISQGQFVQVGDYVKIKPMRCYLENANFAGARGTNRAAEQLPETIKVRLISANGEVTGIGTISTKTGEGTMDKDAWYSLDGRRIEGKPSTKGVYINNGNKVVIK